MKDELRDYLLLNSAANDVKSISDTDSLLESGVIVSASMIDLIAYLEKTHGISIDEDDLIPENFDSVKDIEAYVRRKRLDA